MKMKWKKLTAWVLTLAMVLTMLPANVVFAEGPLAAEYTQLVYSEDAETGEVTASGTVHVTGGTAGEAVSVEFFTDNVDEDGFPIPVTFTGTFDENGSADISFANVSSEIMGYLYISAGTGVTTIYLNYVGAVGGFGSAAINGFDVDQLYLLPGTEVTVESAAEDEDKVFGGWEFSVGDGFTQPENVDLSANPITFSMPAGGVVGLYAWWNCDHRSEDYDHWCDICSEYMRDLCTDEDGDHQCDNGERCGAVLSDLCGDENDDHICDTAACARVMQGLCEDGESADHACEVCQRQMRELCEDSLVENDGDTDHNCDICGQLVDDCWDSNSDWICDECGAEVVCDHWLWEAVSNGDGTHKGDCDGCGEPVTEPCDYEQDYDWDETAHWDACICGEVDPADAEKTPHTFEDNYYYQIEGDTFGHNHECDFCWYQKYEPHVDEDQDGTCDLCDMESVAAMAASVTIGDTTTGYAVLGEALAAAQAGTAEEPALLRLWADCDVAETADGTTGSVGDVVTTGVMTIDLNGYTIINSESSIVLDVQKDKETTKVTITDTSETQTGLIDAGETTAVSVMDGACVIIEGGTFRGSTAVNLARFTDQEPPELIINGGRLEGGKETGTGLYVDGSQVEVLITGGYISGWRPIQTLGTLTIQGAPELVPTDSDVPIQIYYFEGVTDLSGCTSCAGWKITNWDEADLVLGEGLKLPLNHGVYLVDDHTEQLDALAEDDVAIITDHIHIEAASDGDHICDVQDCGVTASTHSYDSETGICGDCGKIAAALVTYGDGSCSVEDDLQAVFDGDADAADSSENVVSVKLLRDVELEDWLEVDSASALELDLNGYSITVAGQYGVALVNLGSLTVLGSGAIIGSSYGIENIGTMLIKGDAEIRGDMCGVLSEGKAAISGDCTIIGGGVAVATTTDLTITGSPVLNVTGKIPEEYNWTYPSAHILTGNGVLDLSECNACEDWTILNGAVDGEGVPVELDISNIRLPACKYLADSEGEKVTDSVAAEAVVTVKFAHTPGEAVEENRVESTCTVAGSYDSVVYCSVCETYEISREKKTLELAAHTPGEAVEEKRVESTCTVAGSYDEVVYCSVCDTELSRQEKPLELAAHTPGEAVEENRVESTCTVAGSYDSVVYCSVCETYEISREKKTLELAAHTPGEAVEEKRVESTCTVAGSYDEVVYCSVCETYEISRETIEIPAEGHIYASASDLTCESCGTVQVVRSVPIYRMYNPNSGEHFYTGSEEERDNLVEVGWNYEGVAFNFPKKGEPVYRIYNPITGDHLYTMDVEERDSLLAEGWNYEGVAFNSAPETGAPQYRLWNPNAKVGAWHYTGSEEERDHLISLGWVYQGIGWYSSWK